MDLRLNLKIHIKHTAVMFLFLLLRQIRYNCKVHYILLDKDMCYTPRP